MKTLKVALPSAILAAGFLLCVTSSYGKPEYAKKEGNKACIYCHEKAGTKEVMAKNLNETGKCYAKNDHKDLAKCPVPEKK